MSSTPSLTAATNENNRLHRKPNHNIASFLGHRCLSVCVYLCLFVCRLPAVLCNKRKSRKHRAGHSTVSGNHWLNCMVILMCHINTCSSKRVRVSFFVKLNHKQNKCCYSFDPLHYQSIQFKQVKKVECQKPPLLSFFEPEPVVLHLTALSCQLVLLL